MDLSDDDLSAMNIRLRAAFMESRLHVIGSQFVLAFTFCQMAETKLLYGRSKDAGRLVGKVRHAYDSLHQSLAEPQQVPEDSLKRFQTHLAILERRILRIESQLGPEFRSQSKTRFSLAP
jgi:hypothetical protein